MTTAEGLSAMQWRTVLSEAIEFVYGRESKLMGKQEILARLEGTKAWISMGSEITNVNAARAFAHSLDWEPGDVKMIETKFANGRTTFLHRVEQRHDFLVYPIRGTGGSDADE